MLCQLQEKGYFVKENAPIYLTTDMDKTARWFEDVLGWYSNIVERDSNGNGCCGVVFDMLPEVVTPSWGGKTCSLATIDGYIIDIFE